VEITFIHCQKAFYFYVEFICQISEAEKLFLQLSSRDAVTYVYKKTIFELPCEHIKKIGNCSQETRSVLDIVSRSVQIQKILVTKIIQSSDNHNNNHSNNHNNNNNNNKKFIDIFADVSRKIINSNLDIQQSIILKRIVELLYCKLDTADMFYDVLVLVVQKISKKPQLLNSCEQKMNDVEFDDEFNKCSYVFDAAQIAKFILHS